MRRRRFLNSISIMGAGASATTSALKEASADDLATVAKELSEEERQKLRDALNKADEKEQAKTEEAPAAAVAKDAPAAAPAADEVSSSWADYAAVAEFSEEEIKKLIDKLPAEHKDLFKSDDFVVACKEEFDKVDVDKNGALEGDELVAAVKASVPADYSKKLKMTGKDIGELIMAFDTNKNGKIEPDEFTRFTTWLLAMHICEGFIS